MEFRFYTAVVQKGTKWDRVNLSQTTIQDILTTYNRFIIAYENVPEVQVYEFTEKPFKDYLNNLTDKSILLNDLIISLGLNPDPTLPVHKDLTTFRAMESTFYNNIWDMGILDIKGGNLAIPDDTNLNSSFITDISIKSKLSKLNELNTEKLFRSSLFFINGLAQPVQYFKDSIYLPGAAKKLSLHKQTNLGIFSFAEIKDAKVVNITPHIRKVKELKDRNNNVWGSEVSIVDHNSDFFNCQFNIVQAGHYGSFEDKNIEVIDRHTLKLTIMHDTAFWKLDHIDYPDRVKYKKDENVPHSGNIRDFDVQTFLSQGDSFLITMPKDVMTKKTKLINRHFNGQYQINEKPNGLIVKDDGQVFNFYVSDIYDDVYTLTGPDNRFQQVISDSNFDTKKDSTLLTELATIYEQIEDATMYRYYKFNIPE